MDEPLKYRVLVITADPEVCAAVKTAPTPSCEVSCVPDGQSGVTLFQQQTPDLVILDDALLGKNCLTVLEELRFGNSEVPVIVITTTISILAAVKFIETGGCDIVSKPFERDELWTVMRKALERGTLLRQVASIRADVEARIETYYETSFVATGAMKEVVTAAKLLAKTDACVLLEGESGTGKQSLAHGIHHWSTRRALPYVSIDCAALTEHELEIDIFGREADGYRTQVGKIELAGGGTLLLLAIGELSLGIQGKILALLQNGQFCQVGGGRQIRSNARLIATATANLETAVNDGRFREDLFTLLSGSHLRLPPLRHRLEDLPALVEHCLDRAAIHLQLPRKRLSVAAFKVLTQYAWPGNIRELEAVITRAAILSSGNEIEPKHLFLGPPLDKL
jgi:two-component system, NtrC family, response regulator AtoC